MQICANAWKRSAAPGVPVTDLLQGLLLEQQLSKQCLDICISQLQTSEVHHLQIDMANQPHLGVRLGLHHQVSVVVGARPGMPPLEHNWVRQRTGQEQHLQELHQGPHQVSGRQGLAEREERPHLELAKLVGRHTPLLEDMDVRHPDHQRRHISGSARLRQRLQPRSAMNARSGSKSSVCGGCSMTRHKIWLLPVLE